METVTKAGRYEIVGELGRGAMGIVYKAVDPVIGRTVAVKTIRLSEEGTGLNRAELLARFQTEARAAGLLTHPNIVVVYDAGEEDGLYYITMELVEGRNDIFYLGVMLYEMITGEKPFPGQNITTVIYKIVNEEPVPPRQIDASIHPGISTVVLKALAKEPEQRYQSCREMLEDLRN